MSTNASPLKTFTLYWANGKKTQVHGENLNHATASAGLGVGAIAGLAFHREGEDDSFGWNPIEKSWELHDMQYYGYDA